MRKLFARPETLLATLVFLALAATCVGVWWQIDQHEQAVFRQQTQLAADQIGIRMEEFLTVRLAVAEAVREHITAGGVASQDDFLEYVAPLVAAFSGLQAINWIDETGVIRWVAPYESNAMVVDASILESPVAGPYLREALETQQPRVTRRLELLQGGQGFAAYLPVRKGEASPGGCVNLVARIDSMLDICLARGVKENFHVAINEGGEAIYSTQNPEALRSSVHLASVQANVLNQSWELLISPRTHLIASHRSFVDEAALALALFVAGLVSLMTRSMLIGRAAIRQRDQQLAAIVDRLPGAIYSYHLNPTTSERTQPIARGLDRLFGPKTAERVGENPDAWIQLIHADDDAMRKQHTSRAIRELGDFNFECRIATDDGYKWFHSLGSMDPLPGGLIHCHGLMLDVDTRRRADEALRRSEQLQSAIMRSSPDYILLLDVDGRICFMNKSLPGMSTEEVIGRPFDESLPSETQKRAKQSMDHVVASHTTDRYEFRTRDADGSEYVFESVVGPVIEDGAVVSLVQVTRDVTEQRAATQRIWDQEQFLEQAADVGNIGCWTYDLSEAPDAIKWSDSVYRIFGIKPGAFDGRRTTFVNLIHPDDRDAVHEASQRAIAERSNYSIDHRTVRPDGSVRWIHEQGRAFYDEHGTPVRMLGICQDITERRMNQEALQRVAEAVSSEAGDAFFRTLVQTLCEVTGASHAFVGRISDDEPGAVKTLAYWADGSLEANFCYTVEGTPCADVADQKMCIIEANAAEQFPDDRMLREMAVESYAGVPLVNSRCQTIGLLVVLDTKPLTDESMVRSLIQVMGTRAATELEREEHLRLLRESEDRYRAFIAGSPDAVWRFTYHPPIDTSLSPEEQAQLMYERAVLAECNDICARRYGGQCAADVIGRPVRVLRPSGDQAFLKFLAGFVRRGHRTTEMEIIETDPHGSERIYMHNSHGVIEQGHLLHVWGTHRDVTEQKRSDQRQQLMMRELDHRVKNNLAAVLSLAHQSLREASSFEHFSRSFTGRIAAMAQTHEALASTRWDGVRLRTVLNTSLGPFATKEQVSDWVDGPDITLPARAAMPVCLTLHELATNASKHGALGHDGGSLRIRWHVADGCVHLTWQEHGTTMADSPPDDGLGLRLIRGLISHEIGGEVDVSFGNDGLTCTLKIPVNEAPNDSSFAARASAAGIKR